MRTRVAVAIALLSLPAGLTAQRLPRIGGQVPAGPRELPPQAPAVARSLAYRRLRLAIETYPLISYFQSPGFTANGAVSAWTSFGAGTRADYRVTRFLSVTADVTSTFLGGPARTETIELGTRLHPQRNERRIYPFADLRVGYVHAFDSQFNILDNGSGFTTADQAYGGRYAYGPGAVGGVGMEIGLTRRFSLTTAGSVLRSHMTSYGYAGNRPVTGDYFMNSYRYTLGIRYNPVRVIVPPNIGLP